MNRSEFLKSLGLGASGLIIPVNLFVNTKQVKVYDNFVRGLTYYDFRKVRNELKVGDQLQLKREQDNKYDRFAIQVNFNEFRLGYIATFENIVLANMMDLDVGLNTIVSQHTTSGSIYDALAVGVYAELVVANKLLTGLFMMDDRADNAVDIYRKGGIWK